MFTAMDKVRFIPPTSAADLRVVMSNATADQHDHFAVAYRTPFGEVRVVSWLTLPEASRRGSALRKRGYRVAVGPMDV